MQQAIVNRFSSLGMFGSALVPSFNDDDDDDDDDNVDVEWWIQAKQAIFFLILIWLVIWNT